MALHAPHSGYVEVLRNIRIAADQSTAKDGAVMGVMSVLPDEGKTMTAVNYANALACSGARVLLIDADLRHPGLSDALQISSGTGIVQVLMDGAAMADAVRTVPATGLDVLPCIRSSPFAYAGEMLRLPKMTALMAEARSTYDYVVLDLPPIGAVVDAKVLLPHMDSALLVAEWGRTPRDLIRQQVLRETHIRDKVLGVALNKVRLDDLPSYSRTDGAENYIDVYSDYQTVR
jgi:succinoglycan biosynthesis transport protein ExoP